MWDAVFRSDFRRIAGGLALVAAGLVVMVGSACSLGDGSCLRMSECASGYTCVEGTCRSDIASDAPNLAPGASDASGEAASASATPKASSGTDAAPAPVDGSVDALDAASVDAADAAASDAAADASDAGETDAAVDAAPDV
jgi:hypothetical protein